jgi:hypothetical protein
MIITFPIKTISEANSRGHWSVRHKRNVRQQRDFTLLWRSSKTKVELPATVIFTRYSVQTMDSDGLVSAFKHVRDALAREIGIDDGSSLLRFEYRQERIDKREHWFTVEIKN